MFLLPGEKEEFYFSLPQGDIRRFTSLSPRGHKAFILLSPGEKNVSISLPPGGRKSFTSLSPRREEEFLLLAPQGTIKAFILPLAGD